MKRVAFIGQAMPRKKEENNDWPSLNKWLFSIGVTVEEIRKNFFYTALVNYFPGVKNGSHLVPTPIQIADEYNRLKKDLIKFKPEVIVTIGTLSLSYCFDKKNVLLKDYVGKSFLIDPYKFFSSEILVIPFPHPSGASLWYKNPENKLLLKKALQLLKMNI